MITYSGEFGLPNTLREQLLQIGRGNLALFMDAVLYSGLRPGKRYTYRAICQALLESAVELSPWLIRRTLQSIVFPQQKIIRGRGRPEINYKIPTPEELMAEFKVGRWKACDQLLAGDFRSLTAYRAGLHREFIKRVPGSYSRAFLANRLGVGKRTTANYDRRAGVTVETRTREIRLWDRTFAPIVDAATPGKAWLKIVNRSTGNTYTAPALAGMFHKLLNTSEIYLVTQLTNHYHSEAAIDLFAENSLSF